MRPRRVTWIKTKREGVKNGCYGALKPDMLALSCKSDNYIDAGTRELGVRTTHEISPCSSVGDAGLTHLG